MPRPYLVALLLAAGPAPAAEPAAPAERVKKDLFFLAGDECQGRGLQTEGLRRAGQYIADQFRAAGLTPGGTDGFFQPFTVATGKPTLGPANTFTLARDAEPPVSLSSGDEYAPLCGGGPVPAAGLVFVGYGISAPSLKYDDYAGVDVAGKWVVVLRRTPRAESGDRPFDPAPDSRYSSLGYKLQEATARKAAGVVLVNDATYGKADDRPVELGVMADVQPPPALPVVQLKRAALGRLLPAGKRLADVEAGIDADNRPDSFPLAGWTAAAEVDVTRPTVLTRNVVGVLPGAGPLADQTVVVGAHYDHLGLGEKGSMLGAAAKGKVHFGADDNASGTAGLIELARRLAAVKDRAGRRVVFVAFSGEEQGLFGSIHYCEHPAFPLKDTAFMLNLDMIGRASPAADEPGKDRLVVYGTGTGTGLDAAADEANGKCGFNLIKIPAGVGPSDHNSFFLKKVPVLFLFTGTHRDYHRPTDTPDKVNYPGLLRVVDYAQQLAEHFAGLPDRPAFEAAKGGWYDPTEQRPRKGGSRPAARLGIMPGNYQDADGGVLVEDVVPGGAAEAAGLRKGDRIVELGGKPVKNIDDYMAGMAVQKAGVAVDVVVVRKDKRETVKVTPK